MTWQRLRMGSSVLFLLLNTYLLFLSINMTVCHRRESLQIQEKISQGFSITDDERSQYKNWVSRGPGRSRRSEPYYILSWDYFKHPTSPPSKRWLKRHPTKKMLYFLESVDDSFQDWLGRLLYFLLFEAFGFYSCGVWLEWLSQRNFREIDRKKTQNAHSQRSYLDDRLQEFKVQELVREPVVVDAVEIAGD